MMCERLHEQRWTRGSFCTVTPTFLCCGSGCGVFDNIAGFSLSLFLFCVTIEWCFLLSSPRNPFIKDFHYKWLKDTKTGVAIHSMITKYRQDTPEPSRISLLLLSNNSPPTSTQQANTSQGCGWRLQFTWTSVHRHHEKHGLLDSNYLHQLVMFVYELWKKVGCPTGVQQKWRARVRQGFKLWASRSVELIYIYHGSIGWVDKVFLLRGALRWLWL